MKRIIDSRRKEKFMMDDEYMNGMARHCGWKGTIVYLSLCRHANKNQTCFPSIKLMAEENAVNRKTILSGLELLEQRNVIAINKTRSKSGQWLNNTYELLDKSVWIYDQVLEKDMANQVPLVPPPSPSQGPDQVRLKDTKETHSEGNTFKETHNTTETSSVDENFHREIIAIIDLFRELKLSVAASRWYSNKTQRKACTDLLAQFSLEQVLKVISVLPKTNQQKYLPKITTPLQLLEKWTLLEAGLRSSSKPTRNYEVI